VRIEQQPQKLKNRF